MNLPYFYVPKLSENAEITVLPEDTSLHIVQVLRMKQGERLMLTDGNGKSMTTEIIAADKKAAKVQLLTSSKDQPFGSKILIAISLI
ncbi:MAG: RsmE family RNA methyltransferase, partial [Chitinophagaceae bacterium]